MRSPALDIAELLESSEAGLNYVIGTNLFVDNAPHTIGKCTTVIDVTGGSPALGYVYEYPSIQLFQRGDKHNYLGAYNTLHAARTYLHGLHGVTIGGSTYILIKVISDILSLGYDDNNRPLLSCNFRLHRTG